MGRRVALKTIRQLDESKPELIERFLGENRTSAALSHPNIISVFDADCTSGTVFLVMEYLEGKNLFQLIDETVRLDVPTVCTVVRQATAGIKHAHDRGIIRRGIEPGNLFVVPCEGIASPGLVKVLDFGLAKFLIDEGICFFGTPAGFTMGR